MPVNQLECAACISDQTFAQGRAIYYALRQVRVFRRQSDVAMARRAAATLADFCGYTDAEAAALFADSVQHNIIDHFGLKWLDNSSSYVRNAHTSVGGEGQ